MNTQTIILIIVIIITAFVSFLIGKFIGKLIERKKLDEIIEQERKDAIQKSRAVLGGQFAENLAPYLPNFPFNPSECKFVGKPIDFIVFKGLDNKQTEEIIFVEVKSGKSKLSGTEKHIKEVIQNKKVKWMEYRVDESITKSKDG